MAKRLTVSASPHLRSADTTTGIMLDVIIAMIPAGMFLLTSVALAVSVIRLAKKRTLVQEMYCIEIYC